jgi:protein O-GlcNAc transferase
MNVQEQQLLTIAEHYFNAKNFKHSEHILKQLAVIDSDNAKVNELLAYINDAYGRHEEAYLMLIKSCSQENCSGLVLYHLGAYQLEKGLFSDSIVSINKAIKKIGIFFEALYGLGSAYANLGNYEKAISYYKECKKIKPDSCEANFNIGKALDELRQYEEAIEYYTKAINAEQHFIEAWLNKGITLNEIKRHDEALFHYEEMTRRNIDCAEGWFNRGATLNYLGRHKEALGCYDKAVSLRSDYADAWFNRGVTLSNLQNYSEAFKSYTRTIELKPNFADAWLNKGIVLSHFRHYEEALLDTDMAMKLRPEYAEAWSNKALILNNLGRFKEAEAHYAQAIKLKPDLPFLLGDWAHTKMRGCDWTLFEEVLKKCIAGVKASECSIRPFPLLALTDDSGLHKKCAVVYINQQAPINKAYEIEQVKSSEKIRVGYYSADFHNHATCQLMIKLFEIHDKKRFEIYGFSFGPNINDAMRERASRAFNQFYVVNDMSDLEVIQLSREIKIDIAIDLKGLTQDSRPNIFLNRCAPIQVSYLGYPGTLGTSCMDYIIADKFVIPPDHKEYYVEKIIYLPNSYQVNNSDRKIAAINFTRAEVGLPLSGFVFCCFNNSYKILPEIFNIWMEILKSIDGSVLWLLEDNLVATDNLKKEALSKGVSDKRLVFSKKISPEQHLARLRLADLFLDTAPYNAHTTASDALWAGVPVLTCVGNSFASRVGASLLNAIGLDDFIVTTLNAYQAKAIELALNPIELSSAKERLLINKTIAPLFNTELFAKNLEATFEAIYLRHCSGNPPDTIEINQCDA